EAAKPQEPKVAMLSPPDRAGDGKPTADEIPRLLITELRRVGCFTGSIEGIWNDDAQRSLDRFNKSAGTRVETKLASLDALDLVRSKQGRVCPLVCDYGYQATGDTCTKIICKAGFELGEDNTCRKAAKKPVDAKSDARPRESAPAAGAPAGNSELSRCGATSCSGALRGCIRKAAVIGGNPDVCEARYNQCMQTGTFNGRFCHHSGLARN